MKLETIEAAVAASAPKIMYSGAGASGVGFWLSNEMIGLVGLCIALAGFVLNWHYKHKHFKLAKMETEARLAERGFYE